MIRYVYDEYGIIIYTTMYLLIITTKIKIILQLNQLETSIYNSIYTTNHSLAMREMKIQYVIAAFF